MCSNGYQYHGALIKLQRAHHEALRVSWGPRTHVLYTRESQEIYTRYTSVPSYTIGYHSGDYISQAQFNRNTLMAQHAVV